LIKLAMVDIGKEFAKQRFASRMVLQIHDELVFNVERDEEKKIIPLVRERMEGVMTLSVPVRSA